MKHRRRISYGWPETVAVSILVLCVLFVGASLFMVAAGGLPSLLRALGQREIRFSLILSMTTAVISSVICLAMAVPSAYALARLRLPWRRVLQTILELPLSLPPLVLGLCLLLLFSSPMGKGLREAGFPVVFHPNGIVLAQILVNLPYVLRIVVLAFLGTSRELEDTARLDGATRWQSLRLITLPLCRVQLLSALVLAWARGLGEFGGSLMLAGVTRMKTETLAGSIYLNIATGDNELAMACAFLLLVISGGVLVFTNQLNGRKEE